MFAESGAVAPRADAPSAFLSVPMSLPMAVNPFMSWFQTPEAGRRAEAASALALAYLYGDLDEGELRGAEVALTAALDDPSPVVRRALAEALAGAEEAPRHIVVALANDQPEVAAIVLSRSPALRDADLVDCVAVADGYAQAAAAIRPSLSEPVCDALASVGGREACVAMALNPGSRLAPAAMARMIERFGEDPEFREAMLARPELPHGLRHDLAMVTARGLSAFATACGWMSAERAERLTREARDVSAAIVASQSCGATLDLARHLRRAGHLTPGLLLRALLSGDHAFFAAALADLADVATARAQGLMRDPRSAGFAALCERAGLPKVLAPAFVAAVEATRGFEGAPDGRLSLRATRAVVDACEAAGGEQMGKAMAMLRRFEAEAALEAARTETARAAQAEADAEAEALAQAETERLIEIETAERLAGPGEAPEITIVAAIMDDGVAKIARAPDVAAPYVSEYDAAAATYGDAITLDAAALGALEGEAPAIEMRGGLDLDSEEDAPAIAIDPETVAVHDAGPRARRGLFSLWPLGRRAA